MGNIVNFPHQKVSVPFDTLKVTKELLDATSDMLFYKLMRDENLLTDKEIQNKISKLIGIIAAVKKAGLLSGIKNNLHNIH